jgi:predicted O-methyltransferase YrrM
MSRLRGLGNALVPMSIREKLRGMMIVRPDRIHFPLKNRLSWEIVRLEMIKSEKPVEQLKTFPEMSRSSWAGLGTLAYQMVLRYKPKVIVELGTHVGYSALAMGLALRDLGEGGRIFAVDSWEGDPQAGFYGEEVYQTFLKRREELKLESTIVPLKMYFDEALDKVDTPIDLLHIDGLHTWDAVNHDWETFGPLVRPGGLVIFHDVNTHFEDLRRFWDGISKSYESHGVAYSCGLGIIRTKA